MGETVVLSESEERRKEGQRHTQSGSGTVCCGWIHGSNDLVVHDRGLLTRSETGADQMNQPFTSIPESIMNAHAE